MTICDKCSKEIPINNANDADQFGFGTLCNDCYAELLAQGSSPRDEAILFARDLLKQDFIVVDTETTGLSQLDEALTIGILDQDGQVLLDARIKPTTPISANALGTHGITDEEAGKFPPFSEMYKSLILALLHTNTIVAYAANNPENFDARIIDQACQAHSYAPLKLDVIDILTPVAAFIGEYNSHYGNYKWQKLTTAAQYFGIDTTNAHGAVADCRMTLEVLRGMAAAKLSE